MQIELVERARAGDHDAFSVLVRASTPRLYGAAKLILRDPDRAQDAVQEALVLAWRHVRALRDPQAWDAWLYRLTVRACYRLAQTNRRRDLVELHRRVRPRARDPPPTFRPTSPSAIGSAASSAGCPSISGRSWSSTSTSTCR